MHQHISTMKKDVTLEYEKMCPFFVENEKNVPFFLLGDAALFSKIWPVVVAPPQPSFVSLRKHV